MKGKGIEMTVAWIFDLGHGESRQSGRDPGSPAMKKQWSTSTVVGIALGLFVVLLVVVLWLIAEPQSARLHDANPAIRAAAIRRLSRDWQIGELIQALRDENADVRMLAAQHLEGNGPQVAEKALALVHVLADEQPNVRREAAWSLGSLGWAAWPALQDALHDDNPRVRAGAALALCNGYSGKKDPTGWPSREVEVLVPILKQLRDDADAEVRDNADRALNRIR
jgi:HEAT repeat protein